MTKRIVAVLLLAMSICGVADLSAQTDLRSLIGGILGNKTAITLESVAGTSEIRLSGSDFQVRQSAEEGGWSGGGDGCRKEA